ADPQNPTAIPAVFLCQPFQQAGQLFHGLSLSKRSLRQNQQPGSAEENSQQLRMAAEFQKNENIPHANNFG
ncbi:MAG: hypothetical protein D4R65_12650, partial [Verrucomicrobiaceae bacterium]